jgi:gas vesicle protein
MSNSKLLAGFLAGAAVGGILGILMAPDKGEVTRRKIIDKGSDFSDAVKDKFNDTVDGLKEHFSSGKKQSKEGMI